MYCTQQQLIDRFGESELIQLTDRKAPPRGAIDADVVTAAIEDASQVIDSYLSGRYSLPLAAVPAPLKRVACDIARYYLYEDAVTEIVQARYDSAVKFLLALTKGDVNLGAADDTPAPQSSNEAQMESGGRTFGRDTSGGFI